MLFCNRNPPPHHFSTSSHMFSLLGDGGQYPSLRLGTSSSGISEGFPKRFSISANHIWVSFVLLKKWDAASSHYSLLRAKWVSYFSMAAGCSCWTAAIKQGSSETVRRLTITTKSNSRVPKNRFHVTFLLFQQTETLLWKKNWVLSSNFKRHTHTNQSFPD